MAYEIYMADFRKIGRPFITAENFAELNKKWADPAANHNTDSFGQPVAWGAKAFQELFLRIHGKEVGQFCRYKEKPAE